MAKQNKVVDFFRKLFGRARGNYATEVPRVDDGAFQRYVSYYSDRVDTLAGDLISGRLTPEAWQKAMEKEVAHLHTTGYVLYRGGLSEMGKEDFDIIQSQLDAQNAYLAAWTKEMSNGDISAMDAKAIGDRARLYVGAVNKTIQQAAVRSVGLPDLPVYPADGGTECLTFCKCRWSIKKVEGGYDATWTLGVAEHCEGCIERSNKYNPLRIRNGVII